MSPTLLAADSILELLASGPIRINSAIDGLSDDELASRPEPEEWSPFEVLIHIRSCADVWGDQRIESMLSEDEPMMRAVNPTTWVKQADYLSVPFRQSLEDFSLQRARLLQQLHRIKGAQWDRGATFTGFEKPRRYTVHGEADALARHERAHIKQIERRSALLRVS